MHYAYNNFAINMSVPTIWPKAATKYFGQRIGLSQIDCMKLNELYGCFEEKRLARKYIARCQLLGLHN
jgi:hypothetical protein